MTIWALADLHLAIAVPEKSMDAFGEPWVHYMDKIKQEWLHSIQPDDLVLIPGDISWAMHLNEAKVDLEWIAALPGKKLLLRGNHDYWWTSLKQVQAILPPSLHVIQNNAFVWKNFVIGGARLWDSGEYSFHSFIRYIDNPKAKKFADEWDLSPEAEKIFLRELGRLELSLKEMSKYPGTRLVMTHYPPIGADLKDSRVSALLEKYKVRLCVFGHLHNIAAETKLFGEKNGIKYCLASADYLNFKPLLIAKMTGQNS